MNELEENNRYYKLERREKDELKVMTNKFSNKSFEYYKQKV